MPPTRTSLKKSLSVACCRLPSSSAFERRGQPSPKIVDVKRVVTQPHFGPNSTEMDVRLGREGRNTATGYSPRP